MCPRGKLLDLRRGPDDDGCSGGALPAGDDCFSALSCGERMAPAKVSAFQVNLELTWVTRSVRLHAYAEQLIFREQRPLQVMLLIIPPILFHCRWGRVFSLRWPDMANGNVVL